MIPPSDESIWQNISKALFQVRRTTDERLFTSRVMADIRQRHPAELPWGSFMRWMMPALGVAVASLALALRDPLWTSPLATDTLLFQAQTSDDELAVSVL